MASSVDPCVSPHTRLHEMVRALAPRHAVSIVTVRDSQRRRLPDVASYVESSFPYLQGVREFHLTAGSLPLSLQELMARRLVLPIVPRLNRPGVVLDYNTVLLGRSLQRELARDGHGPMRVYDLADYLPEMVGRTVPPFPGLGSLASVLTHRALVRTVREADTVSTTLPGLPESLGVTGGEVLHVPNGVDLARFRSKPSAAGRRRFGVEGETPVVGYVGTLREWVNFKPVLDALARVQRETGTCPVLVVAGREGEFEALRLQASVRGLMPSLRMLGTIPYEDVPWLLSACDITVVPFRRNRVTEHSVPLKILESFACRVPVACPPLSGIERIFGQAILPCGDTQDYVSVFRDLIRDPKVFAERGREGEAIVRPHFDWKDTLGPLLARVEECLQEA